MKKFWKYMKNNPMSFAVIGFCLFFIILGLVEHIAITIWGFFVLIVFIIGATVSIIKTERIKKEQKERYG